MFAVRCSESLLYVKRCLPARGEIDLSLTLKSAEKFSSFDECELVARSLRAVFGSFNWQPVAVTA